MSRVDFAKTICQLSDRGTCVRGSISFPRACWLTALEDSGQVETERETRPEVQKVDVWFRPWPQRAAIMGSRASPCWRPSFNATRCSNRFDQTPDVAEILHCVGNQQIVFCELRRKNKKAVTATAADHYGCGYGRGGRFGGWSSRRRLRLRTGCTQLRLGFGCGCVLVSASCRRLGRRGCCAGSAAGRTLRAAATRIASGFPPTHGKCGRRCLCWLGTSWRSRACR